MKWTDRWFDLRPHRKQSAAYYTGVANLLLPCGRGSGKSEIAKRRAARELAVKKPWADPRIAYCAPSREWCKQFVWEDMKSLVPRHFVSKVNETELSITTVFGSTIELIGLHGEHCRIEGRQWDFVIVDEMSDVGPGKIDRMIRPALTHRRGKLWMIGVPKRHGQGAKEFKKLCDMGTPGHLKYDPNFLMLSWPSKDIVPADRLAIDRKVMDPKDYTEQYEASWQTIGGLCFYNFSEENIDSEVEYRPDLPIHICCDFNVDYMSWILCHVVGDRIYAFDELRNRDTNTPECLDIIHSRYGNHQGGWNWYGDAASRNRSTSSPKATQTDYAYILNDKRFVGSDAYILEQNPLIQDRYAATNAMLLNANEVRRVFFHPRCEYAIDDFKHRSYKKGTNTPDDRDPRLGHMTDAFGYLVWRLFPLQVHRPADNPIVSFTHGIYQKP